MITMCHGWETGHATSSMRAMIAQATITVKNHLSMAHSIQISIMESLSVSSATATLGQDLPAPPYIALVRSDFAPSTPGVIVRKPTHFPNTKLYRLSPEKYVESNRSPHHPHTPGVNAVLQHPQSSP